MTFYDQKFATGAPAPKVTGSIPNAPARAEGNANAALQQPAYRNRTTLAYWALLTFSFLYYGRPEDFIPGIGMIPVGKISGGIALLGLLLSWGRRREKMPLEIKLVLVLFADMCITVPFAFWRGGAYDVVVNQFSKAAMVALMTSMIVSSFGELRRLLWVQAAAVAILTIASIVIHPGVPGGGTSMRLWGLGGVFSNPNDFAINIAINFPLCLAFFFGSKGILRKLLWAVAVLSLLYGVIATYSRSGLIAMVICFLICIWEFGIKGRRPQVIAAAIFIVMVAVGVAMTTPRYLLRLSTLVEGGDVPGSLDHGSMDARRELLAESIQVTMQHPIFGVGPGNFQAFTKSWHVTHNTYTELSSEAGIPALALFMAILLLTFRNLRKVQKIPGYKSNPQIQLFTNAMRAGLAAYMVGAMFASTAYTLFPYFMVAYVTVLHKIASLELSENKQVAGASLNSRNPQNTYGKQQQQSLAWTR